MAESNILVPVKSFSSPTSWYKTREGLKTNLIKGWNKYGTYFKYASKLTNVPVEILLAFASVESGINPLAKDPNAPDTQGMMQWNYNKGYADEVLNREYKLGRLSEAEKSELAKYGITFNANGKCSTITKAQQLNPFVNILIGAIYIGQYLDSISNDGEDPKKWAVQDGVLRLDRVISHYNAGEGSTDAKNSRAMVWKTVDEAHNNAKAGVVKTYIKKMLGNNGTLDIIVNDLSDVVKV